MAAGNTQARPFGQPIEVLVVDDHCAFADALRIAIDVQPGLRCVGTARTAEEAIALVSSGCRPHVVVMDVHLPGLGGIAAVPPIRGASPSTRVVMVSADVSPSTVVAAVDAGAHGFLPKAASFSRLLDLLQTPDDAAIVEARDLDGAVRHARAARPTPPPPPPPVDLSERERETLLLLAEGLVVKEIAASLHMSVNTCRGHVASLLRKFDAHSQLAVVVKAAQQDLLPNLASRPDAVQPMKGCPVCGA